MALVLEDGTGLTNSNAFADQAFWAIYHAERTNNARAKTAAPDVIDAACIMATRALNILQWAGQRAKLTQALSWPRVYVLNQYGDAEESSTTIPKWLKEATAEQGYQFVLGDRLAEPDGYGLDALSVGKVSLTFSAVDKAIRRIVHPAVIDMCRHALVSTGSAGNVGRVYRA